MKYDKIYLRNKSLLLRKKKYLKTGNFNFNLIFKLIRKHFLKKKIIIAGYYPSNYEVNILKFIEKASEKRFSVTLPVIESKNTITFRTWKYKEPLNINSFGIPEPKRTNKAMTPDLILVPLVAFDSKLNRIGYGKGYYDRGLSKIKKNNKNMIALGIAYSFQKCDYIPTKKYDFKLDYILTERDIISSN